jgi:hypothetical protein
MIVLTDDLTQALVAAAIEHVASGSFSGPLYSASVQLFTNNISLTNATTLAELTAPTYTGYADLAITWSSVYKRSDGVYAILSQLLTFTESSPASVAQIYGYAVYTGTSPKVLQYAELFPEPVTLSDLLTPLNFLTEFALSPDGNSSATIVT